MFNLACLQDAADEAEVSTWRPCSRGCMTLNRPPADASYAATYLAASKTASKTACSCSKNSLHCSKNSLQLACCHGPTADFSSACPHQAGAEADRDALHGQDQGRPGARSWNLFESLSFFSLSLQFRRPLAPPLLLPPHCRRIGLAAEGGDQTNSSPHHFWLPTARAWPISLALHLPPPAEETTAGPQSEVIRAI